MTALYDEIFFKLLNKIINNTFSTCFFSIGKIRSFFSLLILDTYISIKCSLKKKNDLFCHLYMFVTFFQLLRFDSVLDYVIKLFFSITLLTLTMLN